MVRDPQLQLLWSSHNHKPPQHAAWPYCRQLLQHGEAWLRLLPAVEECAVVLTEWPHTATATTASGSASQPAAEATAAGAAKAAQAPIAPAAASATAGSPAAGAGAGAAAAHMSWVGSSGTAAGSRPARALTGWEGIGKGCSLAGCSLPGGGRRPGQPCRRGWCSRGITSCCSCARRHAAAVQPVWGSSGCCPAGHAAAAAWTRACCLWPHHILATQQRSHLCILIAVAILLLAVRMAAAAPTCCRLCRWWWRRCLPLLPRGLGPRQRRRGRRRRAGSRRHCRPRLFRWDGWLAFAQIYVQLVLPMRKVAPASQGGEEGRLWGPGWAAAGHTSNGKQASGLQSRVHSSSGTARLLLRPYTHRPSPVRHGAGQPLAPVPAQLDLEAGQTRGRGGAIRHAPGQGTQGSCPQVTGDGRSLGHQCHGSRPLGLPTAAPHLVAWVPIYPAAPAATAGPAGCPAPNPALGSAGCPAGCACLAWRLRRGGGGTAQRGLAADAAPHLLPHRICLCLAVGQGTVVSLGAAASGGVDGALQLRCERRPQSASCPAGSRCGASAAGSGRAGSGGAAAGPCAALLAC